MKQSLSPKYIKKIGDFVIAWFKKSNSYLLLNEATYALLKVFISSIDKFTFLSKLNEFGYSEDESEALFYEIDLLLETNNTVTKSNVSLKSEFQRIENPLSESYFVHDKKISILYSSEKVKQLVHPSITYLVDSSYSKHDLQISIYQKEDNLVLAKNEIVIFQCLARDYHKLQGKFSLLLMNLIYNTEESDYLACFHASTIAFENKGIMLIGSSGSGKSTLTAILQKEFNMVADDVSYLTKSDLALKSYPAAISIKEGSLKVLESFYANISTFPKTKLNPTKGYIRYIPPLNINYHNEIACKSIILVNYKENAETNLERVQVNEIINVLIPESWISGDDASAQKLLNWLSTVNLYKLTYSNSNNISRLLKDEALH